MEKYKRDFKFRSEEGEKSYTWLIILAGIAAAVLAYFL